MKTINTNTKRGLTPDGREETGLYIKRRKRKQKSTIEIKNYHSLEDGYSIEQKQIYRQRAEEALIELGIT